jgi:uncharacterized protein (DUF433 family)/DNA-binding transcriptional MerR regulator
MTVSVLEREMFLEPEAARLLRLPPSTLHYWLEGAERDGRTYKPIVRQEPRGDRVVTWAEFIEAGLLRQYRREHHVPMAELRHFIDLLRQGTGIPYPLAHHRPFVADRQLVLDAQEEAGLDPDFCLVAVVRGQLILTPASEGFVQRVDWADDVAAAWRPADERESPVRMNPDLRFGRPAVRGISTEALWEQTEAGESTEEVAEAYGLSVGEVRWAIAYESAARAA